MIAKAAAQLRRFIESHCSPPRRLSTRYSLVVPCYNVETYIDEFFVSVVSQNIDPECIEIIAVDDGSTDGTAERIVYWMQRCRGLQSIHQYNQGLAAARNTGLARATGEWVSFPDPDDFLSQNYLEEVDSEVVHERSRSLSMISCNYVYYRETTQEIDEHPLSFRFKKARTILPASDLQDHMQLSANSSWVRRKFLEQYNLRFDSRIVPSFEDAHLQNRYLLLNPQTEVAFLRIPTYYYRKRADGSSLLDTAKLRPTWFIDCLRYGSIDLLKQARDIAGEVPRFVQRTVLYDLFFKFRHLVDHPERAAGLTAAQRDEFLRLLKEISAEISCATINTFNVARCYEEHKVGILSVMKGARRPVTSIYVRQHDVANDLFQFSYYSPDPKNCAMVLVNEQLTPLEQVSRRQAKFLDQTFFFEHLFWVKLRPDEYLTVHVDQQVCPVKRRSIHLGVLVSFEQLRTSSSTGARTSLRADA